MISPVSAFVLYAFLWFLTLLVVLPIRLKTQEDVGEVVPGTPRSA
ncbi:MAG: DUF1467 family protein, partial [Rhodobacteraceae bacterium]|nr:DUF1467 family protein [Paracoccaceae bacterium]